MFTWSRLGIILLVKLLLMLLAVSSLLQQSVCRRLLGQIFFFMFSICDVDPAGVKLISSLLFAQICKTDFISSIGLGRRGC